MKNLLHSIKPNLAIPLWGIIGGLALVFIAGIEQNAELVIPIYGLTLVSFILSIKIKETKRLLVGLFNTTFLTFVLMTTIDYLYIINLVNPSMLRVSLYGHLWRIFFLLGFGAAVCFGLAYIALIIKKYSNIAST